MRKKTFSGLYRGLLVFAILFVVSDPCAAVSYTYVAKDISFDVIPAGGSLTGSFQFDPSTLITSNVSITTSPGDAANSFFSGFMAGGTYTTANLTSPACFIMGPCIPAAGLYQLDFLGSSPGGSRTVLTNIFNIDQLPLVIPVVLGLENLDLNAGPGRFMAGTDFFPNQSAHPRFELVPEPASLGLLLLGLVLLAGWSYRLRLVRTLSSARGLIEPLP